MLLEQLGHESSCFATLTYAVNPLVLVADDLQLFLKRLRYYRGPFRFYGVGEYGSEGGRPHWHIALFGVSISDAADIAKAWRGHLVAECRRVPVGSFGGVHVGELNHDSAQYLCKYMCKDDAESSVVRMSRRPGIGKFAVEGIASGLLDRGGSAALVELGDVPSELRVQGKRYPIGRYIRRALREAVGWSGDVPVERRRAMAREKSQESSADIVLRTRKREAAARNLEARVRRKKQGEKL